MNKINKLNVYYHDTLVGTLAKLNNGKIAFQYDEEWLKNGFSISPISLPLKKEVFIPTKHHFGGLFGVFSDSLPDAWGNILVNRILKKNGINPDNLGALDRLAIVGESGMGALTYRPEIDVKVEVNEVDFDRLSKECQRILESEQSSDLDTLFILGGSSGGARPKILTQIDGEEWIVKFQAPTDNDNIGKMEYNYYECAKKCQISISESMLIPSRICPGYFATKRFDRVCGERKHMISVAALLELDFRTPSMDYLQLMKLTKMLTKNSKQDVEQMYRLACFNVFSHNRDDHTKNFTFIYDDKLKKWCLSPAYDLTYSSTYYGEHTTTICNNGNNPGKKELLKLGIESGLKKELCQDIIDEIEDIVKKCLFEYL